MKIDKQLIIYIKNCRSDRWRNSKRESSLILPTERSVMIEEEFELILKELSEDRRYSHRRNQQTEPSLFL